MINKLIDTDNEKRELFKIPVHKKCENPKITVIVPVYKVDKYLTQCLNSICNQTMEELEIIIIDEGDHDRCREIIDYFEAHDPRIVAPHQKNGGYGSSCNLGLTMARGEYISIVESDDCIEPWMYEEMYAYAKRLNADVVKSPFIYATQYGRVEYEYREFFRLQLPENQTFSAKEFNAILRFHGSIWSAIYKTSYLQREHITFSEVPGGAYVDIVFRYDTLTRTDKIAWLNRTYYVYTVDETGEQHNNHSIGSFISRWSEIHERLNKETEGCRNAYAPVLLCDEINDTLNKLRFVDICKDDIQRLHKNLESTDESIIDAAAKLNEYPLHKSQKQDILAFKENPEQYYKNARSFRELKKIVLSVERICQRISSIALLFWFFVTYITSITLETVLYKTFVGQPAVLSSIIHFVCILISAASVAGIALCVFSKVLAKIITFFRSRIKH